MYASLETYDQHDVHCPQYYRRENFEEPVPHKARRSTQPYIDTPELRRKRRGGMGIDGIRSRTKTRENFKHIPQKTTHQVQETAKKSSCQPYDASHPYRYMFDPHYNKYPYGPDYKLVDGEDEGKRYLNVPAYSYPDYGSSTRVMYCDAPPKLWELCDDSY